MALHNEKQLLAPQAVCLARTAYRLKKAIRDEDYALVHELAHGAAVVSNGLLKMSQAILDDDGSVCEYCSVEHLSK